MYYCLSVEGGWQTIMSMTDEPMGPVFKRIEDLWRWQRINLYKNG
jgi:hypothetical protein